MFLDSVQVQTNTSSKISSYIFHYNNLSQLPARFSFSQDHRGYYNGKTNSDFAIITEVPGNNRGLFASDAMIYPLVVNNTGWKTGIEDSNSMIGNNSITLSSNVNSYNFNETRNYKDVSCIAVEKFYNPDQVPESISQTISRNYISSETVLI